MSMLARRTLGRAAGGRCRFAAAPGSAPQQPRRCLSAAAAAAPSPWDIDLRPKPQEPAGAKADAAPRAFSELLCRELCEELRAMDVFAPNEMQAVRSLLLPPPVLPPCRAAPH